MNTMEIDKIVTVLNNSKTLVAKTDNNEDHGDDESTSLLLRNRLSRKGKAILTQGLLVAISVGIIFTDVFYWCGDTYAPTDYRILQDMQTSADTGLKFVYSIYGDDDFVFQDKKPSEKTYLADLTMDQTMRFCLYQTLYRLFNSVIIFSILVPLLIGFAHFLHSLCLGGRANFEPNPEVEKLYAMTNSVPFVDTVLEIRITWKYGSRAYLFLSTMVFLFISASTIALLSMSVMTVSTGIKLAAANTIFALYQQFGEMNEYWVHYYSAKPPVVKESDINYLGMKLRKQYRQAKKLGFEKDYNEALKKIDETTKNDVEVKKLLDALQENQEHAKFILLRTRKNMPEAFRAELDETESTNTDPEKALSEADLTAIGDDIALGISFFLPFLPKDAQEKLKPFLPDQKEEY